MSSKEIDFVRDFTRNPGGRYRRHGPKSGEEFRQEVLEPAIRQFDRVNLKLDGAVGFPSSFIDEAFGVLVEVFGFQEVMKKLFITLTDDAITMAKIRHVQEAHKSIKL